MKSRNESYKYFLSQGIVSESVTYGARQNSGLALNDCE